MIQKQNLLYNQYLIEKRSKQIIGGKSGGEYKPTNSEPSEEESDFYKKSRSSERIKKKRWRKKRKKKEEILSDNKKIVNAESESNFRNNRLRKRERSKKLKLEETKRKTRKIKKEKIIKNEKKDTDSSFDPEKVTPPSERDLIISDGSHKGTLINSQKNIGKAKTTQEFFLDNPDESIMSCNDEEYKENIKLELEKTIPDYEYEYYLNNNEENEEKSVTKNSVLTIEKIEKTKENDITMTENKVDEYSEDEVDEELYLDQEIPDSVFSFLVEKEKVQKKKLKREREKSFGDYPKKRRNLPRKVKRKGPIKYSGYKLREIVDDEEKKKII